ncbi:MAG: type II toxin-antitoxin system prevent-host-death family antitoxin [Clostridia bacterium]|nr:type II toxin-antitoxin system prevent-host-death family antitoxin [Clostridia bacterium]
MTNVVATATEVQNNFGRYLKMVMSGDQVTVTRNGQVVARVIPKDSQATPITDSLRGILKGAPDLETAKDEFMREKYGMVD